MTSSMRQSIMLGVLAAVLCSPLAACPDEDQCEQARAATQAFYRAEESQGEEADAMIEVAIGLWEKCLARQSDNLEAHSRISYLLSRVIGRAWERGEPTDSEALKPLWARVAFHRERVMVLTDGKAMRKDEVAEAYMQAGDFSRAEHFVKQDDNRLASFFFYLRADRPSSAETTFASLTGFESRYLAASGALRYQEHEVALHCGNLMLTDEQSAHRRAAVYCILAEANGRLNRWDVALVTSRKAVQLNPNSPWGWFWLAEVYKDRGFYAAEAVARKRELSLFTGDTVRDWIHRGEVYAKLAHLYGSRFGQPEAAIQYYYRQIDAAMRLPVDAEEADYSVYRAATCSGAFMGLVVTMVQDLHDRPRAQQTFEWASFIIPSFPSEPLEREWLVSLGLRLPLAEAPSK